MSLEEINKLWNSSAEALKASKIEAGIKMIEEALQLIPKLGTNDHPDYHASRFKHRLGQVLLQVSGEATAAIKLYKEAMDLGDKALQSATDEEIIKEIKTQYSDSVFSFTMLIVHTETDLDKIATLEQSCLKAKDYYEEIHGKDSFNMLKPLRSVAMFYERIKNIPKAIESLKEAYEIAISKKEHFLHQYSQLIFDLMVDYYCATNDLVKAEDTAKNVFQLLMEYHGQGALEHQYGADAMRRVALVNIELQKYTEAEKFVNKAITIWARIEGESSVNVAKNLVLLAQVFERSGSPIENIVEKLEQAKKIFLSQEGESSPNYQKCILAINSMKGAEANGTTSSSTGVNAGTGTSGNASQLNVDEHREMMAKSPLGSTAKKLIENADGPEGGKSLLDFSTTLFRAKDFLHLEHVLQKALEIFDAEDKSRGVTEPSEMSKTTAHNLLVARTHRQQQLWASLMNEEIVSQVKKLSISEGIKVTQSNDSSSSSSSSSGSRKKNSKNKKENNKNGDSSGDIDGNDNGDDGAAQGGGDCDWD